jgi:hypothetical protein
MSADVDPALLSLPPKEERERLVAVARDSNTEARHRLIEVLDARAGPFRRLQVLHHLGREVDRRHSYLLVRS